MSLHPIRDGIIAVHSLGLHPIRTGLGAVRLPAVGDVTSITFVASAVANAATIVIPAGAQAGDVAVLCDYAHFTGGTTAPTTVVPTDWTSLVNSLEEVSQGTRHISSYKILGEIGRASCRERG